MNLSRRTMLRRASAAVMLGPLFKATQGSVSAQARVNRNSAPSGLRITDMRACRVAANYDYPIIKILTNQDVYGLGEVRDAGVEGIALILKPYLVGKDPLNLEANLRGLRQFAGHGRMGLTFFKMDLHTELVADRPGAVNERGVATEKGLGYLCEYIEAIRDTIGWGAPLAADHFGPLNVKDAIRYAKAFEKYQLSWAEDMVPWTNWQGLKEIRNSTATPILTGEDVFGLRNGFDALIDNRAVDAIHPDIETSGGLLETKRIADYAALAGIQVAMHHAGSPVGGFAGYHCAATFSNFLAMENHALDMPWWQDLVSGVAKPIVDKGYVAVPETPGLGIELNDEVVKEHLRRPGYFEPTPMFDDPIVSGFRPGGAWPHFDENGKWCNCVSYQ